MGRAFFAAVGDVHGEMRVMEGLLHDAQERHAVALDFVLQVGDFEPHRDATDLSSMAAPAKYRKIGDFPRYVSGECELPWPVYFIGGNHEPYAFLDQYPEGGEIAPGFTYLGRTGQVEVGGIRVAGLSGIYKASCFGSERPPVSEIARRSNKDYIGFNEDDFLAALDFSDVDVLLLHDWPSGIASEEDLERWRSRGKKLERLREVGNHVAREVVDALQPQLVLCGHMHFSHRFSINHGGERSTDVACLSKVGRDPSAVAVFEVTETGTVHELTQESDPNHSTGCGSSEMQSD